MGCASSAPAADGAEKGSASAQAPAPADAATLRGEDLTPAALARMRAKFLTKITPGSVVDSYDMGDVVGACGIRA